MTYFYFLPLALKHPFKELRVQFTLWLAAMLTGAGVLQSGSASAGSLTDSDVFSRAARAEPEIVSAHLPAVLYADEPVNLYVTVRAVAGQMSVPGKEANLPGKTLTACGIALSLPKNVRVMKVLLAGQKGLTDKEANLPGKTLTALVEQRSPFASRSGRGAQLFLLPAPQTVTDGAEFIVTLRTSTDVSFARTERVRVALVGAAEEDASRRKPVVIAPPNCATPDDAVGTLYDFALTLQRKPLTGNTAASFPAADNAPVFIAAKFIPALSLRTDFTLTLWLRTVSPGGVVASAWSGLADDAYPLELEILPNGELAAFAATRLAYRKLVSRCIVADGAWHSVALTHDAAHHRMTLTIDGKPADSADTDLGTVPDAPSAPLYFGSRSGKAPYYTGNLDDVKLYSRVKSAAELENFKSYDTDDDAALELSESFHSGADRSRLTPPMQEALPLESSSLPTTAQLKHFRARPSGNRVQLAWDFAGESTVESFSVERSFNGKDFETIHTELCNREDGRYGFTDTGTEASGNAPAPTPSLQPPSNKVAFYRLKKNHSAKNAVRGNAGGALYSDVLKVGFAETKLFRLEQNTPNPFNPSTVVSYELLEASPVELVIFNMLGREVARFSEPEKPAGRYTIRFNAAERNLASGIYLYRLQTTSGAETKKMILTK